MPIFMCQTLAPMNNSRMIATTGEPRICAAPAWLRPSSIIGKLILFGYTWALLHHLCSGIRYFFWDLGYGFGANEREALTWGALIAGISLTVLVWIIAYTVGGGR